MSNNTPELSDVLLYDPGYLNPRVRPPGSGSVADPEDVLAVQTQRRMPAASAGWRQLTPHERFFSNFATCW